MNTNFHFLLQTSPTLNAALKPWRCFRRGLRAMRREQSEVYFKNLSSFLADDPRIKVSEFDGVFTLSSRSDLFRRLVQYGQYEPEMATCCKKLINPQRDIIDVGANVGFYSVFFAKMLGKSQRVLAIEPTPNALKHLKLNLNDNKIAHKVVIFEGVALDTNCLIDVKYIEDREEYSSVGVMNHPSIKGAALKTISTPAKTVDEMVDLHALHPGFVKIDVEGMEHKVFAGMKRTMQVHRPTILAELSDPLLKKNGSSSAQVIASIKCLGYRVDDAIFPQFPAGTRPFGDIICTPE